MSLREKINDQYNVGLKNKNKTLVSTLRLILAAIKDRDIANRTKESKEATKDPEIINLLKKMIKQRQESANLFEKGGRQELLKAEKEEIKIIESFLPKQLSQDETIKICREVVESLGPITIKDMGKIMGILKKKYSDVIDFSKVSLIIKDLLKK
jgi:uncharacterized protein YqeY